MQVNMAKPSGDEYYRYMYAADPPVALKENEFLDDLIIPGAVRCDPLEATKVHVANGRDIEASLTREGFCLTAHGHDFVIGLSSVAEFDEWVLSTALPRLADVVREAVEAAYPGKKVAAAHTIDYTLRCVDSPFESALPVLDAHADFTPESGRARVESETRKFKHGDPAPITLADDVLLINVWQPLVETVHKHPLALCSLESVDDSAYVRKKMLYRHRVGEVFGIRSTPGQRWYYFPEMRSTEALVFVSWTKDGATVPHSGVLDPSDEGPPRRSLETRWAVKLVKSDPTVDEWSKKQHVGKSALDPVPKDVWQILYWPCYDSDSKIAAGAGRAEYLRIIFEECGVPYEEVSANIVDFFWTRFELQSLPVLAPPAIRYNDFIVAQTPVAAKYLAVNFGLYPATPELQARAEQIVATVHEFIAEGRMAFHPVKNTLSYHDQTKEAQPYIDAFKKDRLPRYMAHFERHLVHNAGTFFVGDTLTYVDLQCLVMLQVTRAQWPDAWSNLDMPNLKTFLVALEARPRIRAYLASPRKRPFAGDSLM